MGECVEVVPPYLAAFGRPRPRPCVSLSVSVCLSVSPVMPPLPPSAQTRPESDATMERASITTPDWAAALDGWTVAGTTEWLHSLPSALQGQLHAHLPTGGAPPPPPWDAAAGSVPDLLTELGSSLKPYAATLAEYEYERVAQLQALGRDGLREELRSLGVTPDHRDKLCS